MANQVESEESTHRNIRRAICNLFGSLNGMILKSSIISLGLLWSHGDYTSKADILFWLLEPEYNDESQPVIDIESQNWDTVFL